MIRLSVLLVVAAIAAVLANGHEIPRNCSAQYQEAVQEALRIRTECEEAVFSNCWQILRSQQLVKLSAVEEFKPPTSGIYSISTACPPDIHNLPFLHPAPEMDALCDMETDGGGWTIIQRRISGGHVNFNKKWREYEDGFGDLNGEFWYGLKNIHCLTTSQDVELQVNLRYDNGSGITWTYQLFKIAGPEDKYRLEIGEGEGNSPIDGFRGHNDQPFSTIDKDNDANVGSCASTQLGGWWYHHGCTTGNLNGLMIKWRLKYSGGHSAFGYFTNTEMKIRPKAHSSYPQE